METSLICALPDDLLLRILQHVPTKDAIATSILSRRWHYVWTMLPSLEFKDKGISESIGCFVEKSLKLHKAPKLYKLSVELGPHCPIGVDVTEWVENAVNRGVEYLDFKLLWTAEPTRFPKSLYTCETLVVLTLSNHILVDISTPARLPSLEYLTLEYVVYKDKESLDRLLSSSHVLKWLIVYRHESDNLKSFTVKVSSLEKLYYTSKGEVEEDEVEDSEEEEEDEDNFFESLVIDSPALRDLYLWDLREDYCLIENMHRLNMAFIRFLSDPDVKVPCCYNIKFSQLRDFCFFPDPFVDWLEPLMFFLQNSPILKSLMIYNKCEAPLPSWNQPSIIPKCLSKHLEVFRWEDYEGSDGEKQLLTYILAKSKRLKTIEIYFKATCNVEETQKELESIHKRISKSSRLLFPTQKKWRFDGRTLC